MPKKTSPWSWIPTLYLAQGLPYVAVMTISVIMYKRMGVSNTDIALYTSWLYLPWVIKPLWSPFVDLLKTKRWWIVTMQLFVGAGFAGIAFMIPVPFYFQATLAFFWLLAFSSATHDIAADGFYMLALDTNSQAKFVGIRSTFYRVATIMGQGVLIIFAGFLESATGMEPLRFDVTASPQQIETSIFTTPVNDIQPQEGELRFVVENQSVRIGTYLVDKDSLQLFLAEVEQMNIRHGFVVDDKNDVGKDVSKDAGWWSNQVSGPLGNWIRDTFGEKRSIVDEGSRVGNIGVAAIWLSKSPESGREIILNTALSRGDRSISLIKGERLVFNEFNWDKPAYLVFQLDPKLSEFSASEFKGLSGNITFAWTVTFFLLAGLFVVFGFFHKLFLPRPDSDISTMNAKASSILKDFVGTFASFFKKPGVGKAVFFMLTFRFSEAQALKLISPFLLDSREAGGLGLTTGEVGLVYGTIGIIALTVGGIIGGFAAAKGGLKKWIWPMTLSMLLTTMAFVYLSFSQTESFLLINLCVLIEQFGYGFGFTAYLLYMIYFSEGEHKTAHYAICTGFMALGMMIPGMFAGWMQELLGYNHFFVWVMICSIVPIIALMMLRIDPEFGKAKKNEK